jgi:hypothetical protein
MVALRAPEIAGPSKWRDSATGVARCNVDFVPRRWNVLANNQLRRFSSPATRLDPLAEYAYNPAARNIVLFRATTFLD